MAPIAAPPKALAKALANSARPLGPPVEYAGRPFHLTASCTVANKSESGVNSQALANPSNSPMEIHAIKFSMFWPSTSFGDGGALSCSLALGDIPITNGYIPVWNFARCVDLNAEAYGSPQSGAVANEFLWKLDRPFTIPPGGIVTPKFLHTGTITDSITARIGYAARILDGQKMPKTSCIPFVTSWTSKSINANAAATDSSKETDLANTTRAKLYVHRFVGRVGVQASNGGTIVNSDSSIAYEAIQHNLLTINMADSRGYPTIRTNTVFGAAFNRQTRSWECPHILPNGSYYLANIQYAAPQTSYSNYVNFQAFVSMVGWREVSL